MQNKTATVGGCGSVV